MTTIHIDGALGEGSGGLLRTALAMAAITQQGVHIEQVRGGSKYPGLDPEDLAILQILTRSTQADLKGAELGSDELLFVPKSRPTPVNLRVDGQRNAHDRGPNALIVLNAVLPVLARSGGYSTLEVGGETYGHHALSYDMFANATLALHRKFGIYAESQLMRAGFGRVSNGRVTLEIEPSAVHAVRWDDRGAFLGLQAVVATGEMGPSIAGRALSHLKKLAETSTILMDAWHAPVESDDPGAFVTIWARYERGLGGGVAMGAKGLRSESLAQMAFDETFDWMASNATIDPYLADQILIPAVLADGESSFKISRLTQRFLTSIRVIKHFAPLHIMVKGIEGGPGSVTISK